MNDQKETEQLIIDALGDRGIKFKSIIAINHKPHGYVVGVQHITKSDSAYLNIEAVERKGVTCAYPECKLSYAEHTSDKVAFLQLTKDLTNEEVRLILTGIPDLLQANKIDRIVFVETDKKYRIT